MDKNLELFLISPKILKIPNQLIKEWKKKGVKIHQSKNLLKALPKADVLYATRLQKELFKTKKQKALYKKLKGKYDITLKTLQFAKKKMIIMHPLPRAGEISDSVDNDPRAVYFQQMRNGLYTRMALLKLVLIGP